MSNTIKLLAIDTATDACSVALYVNDQILERFSIAARTHTRLLLPMIDDLLKEAAITLAEIDAFAFGRGPGSFTGIRIACSVIQALSFGINKPVVSVSTLRALAQGAARTSGATQVFASLDARLESLYWGLFEMGAEGIMQPVSDERLSLTDQICLPAGSWQKMTGHPHAEDIVRIAVYEYQAGHAVTAKFALPVYLREEIVKN
ncbi:MAG TPA: tRNA (adenosine(37)-N6)-threonylcarbamoyltransferase complex dimerization subunit type 1 TsaB [Gammaproteobacteria bacterium]|nr:tRNA (adenosine(37)-N6)-threonylcarbamoyltransferase complex dimerization subunit type 1 TsaB [Gammaproteobacteria bacterium]